MVFARDDATSEADIIIRLPSSVSRDRAEEAQSAAKVALDMLSAFVVEWQLPQARRKPPTLSPSRASAPERRRDS